MPEGEGRALLMPVYMPGAGQFAVKVVSLFRNNPLRGMPYLQSVLFLVDGKSGAPLAIVDGEYLTALRTGAASGLATDILSRKNASTLMLFGAGAQSRLQLEGVCAVRDIRHAVVFDQNRERAEVFREEMRKRVLCRITVAQSPREALGADIICTATTSPTPVLQDGDVGAGTHINAIGAYRPEMCEIPPQTVARARVVVDSRSSAMSEAGDIIQAVAAGSFRQEDIHAEIGEIVTGARPGRAGEAEITLFKSVGNASHDLVTAGRALENATKLGLGTTIEL
jgi:ornithine cyclodeaminase/alanine dehydrogenase-like protein (mu-crystallin family)